MDGDGDDRCRRGARRRAAARPGGGVAMLVFDGHLDLAMNAMEWNRDLTRPIDEIREREHERTDKPDRGRGTVSLPEMRRGGVGMCVATQIARYVARDSAL